MSDRGHDADFRDIAIDVRGTVPGVSDSPGLPEGWDPDSDSLEDLVRKMFDSDRSRPPDGSDARTEPPETHATDTAIGTRQPAPHPATPAVPRPAAARPLPRRATTESARARVRTYALAGAVAVLGSLAGWQVLADAPVVTTAAPPTGRTGSASVPSPPTEPQAPANPQAEAAMVLPATAPEPVPVVPAPVGIAFGTRADIVDGWRIAVTRPYRCTVLMAIPVLQQNGTRIVRVTVTLINNTDRPQRAKTWSLTARAGDLPAEMVLWPEEGFRGVPDVILEPQRSARFMIAVRIPDQRIQLKINADRETVTRAVLAGTL